MYMRTMKDDNIKQMYNQMTFKPGDQKHLQKSVTYSTINDTLTHCSLKIPKWVIGKQCRPRSNTASVKGLHCLQIVQSFFLYE